MNQWTVHDLDVWGNDEDGYTVNNVLPSLGTIELADDATDLQIVYACEQLQNVGRIACVHLCEVKSEDGVIYIDHDGIPMLELREVQS